MRNRSRFAAHTRLALVLGLTALLLLAAAGGVATLAEGQARLVLSPSSSRAQVGDLIDVQVRVEGAVDLYGVEMLIRFNPDVLEVVDADLTADGIQIGAPGAFWQGWSVYEARNEADNQDGSITYASFLVGYANGRSGSGTLATIQFRVKAQGLSNLTFDPASTHLAKSGGYPLDTVLVGGNVCVGIRQLYLPLARKPQ